MSNDDLPIMTFQNAQELRDWLMENHNTCEGIWLRIYKKPSTLQSITFEEVLDEGLCFGWSESLRRIYDHSSYLQRFTPRKKVGTQSKRNLERVRMLIRDGRMTTSGLKSLGLDI